MNKAVITGAELKDGVDSDYSNITAWALLKIMVYFSVDTHTSKYCLYLVKSNNLVIVTCNY